MAEESSGERSEEPTGRRLEQAREKGQIARSKELGTAAVLISAACGFYMLGPSLAKSLTRHWETSRTGAGKRTNCAFERTRYSSGINFRCMWLLYVRSKSSHEFNSGI